MISFRQREKVEKFKFIRHYTIQINPTLLTLKSYPFRVSYTPIYERRIYVLTIQGGPNKKFVCSRRRRKERPKERAALRQQQQQRRFECALSGSLCGLQLHILEKRNERTCFLRRLWRIERQVKSEPQSWRWGQCTTTASKKGQKNCFSI